MITKKDQGGAVGFDSHYRSRPFRIPYKSNLCTNIIMIHSVAKKFQKRFGFISEKIHKDSVDKSCFFVVVTDS